MSSVDQRESVLILDRGNAELIVPAGWTISAGEGGSLKVVDPRDQCSLEISYLRVPVAGVKLPDVDEILRMLMAEGTKGEVVEPIRAAVRGPVRVAWYTYSFECDDTELLRRRPAFGRLVLAGRGAFHALMTCSWWHDDDSWARPVVDRAVETLDLGDGRQLSSPSEHWAVKKRN